MRNRRYSVRRKALDVRLESLESRCLLTVSFPSTESFPVDSNPAGFAVGDFNKDGLPDIATATAYGTVNILLDKTGANFSAGTTLNLGTPGASSAATGIATADLAGNGDLGLIVPFANNGATTTTGVMIFKGNGDGTFQSPVSIPTSDPISFAVGDLNGDGKPDFAVMETSGLEVFLNNGDGTFAAPATYPALSTGSVANAFSPLSHKLAVGDFNGDGKADLALSTVDSDGKSVVAIYQNAGNGTFANPVAASGLSGLNAITAQAFAGNGASSGPADLNADSHTDLVELNPSVLQVALNNGSGGFSAPTSYSATSARSVAIADFDGDGKQDVAVLGSSAVSIYTNNGDGTLGTPTSYNLPATDTEPAQIAVADFDGDGKPDVAILNDSPSGYSVSFLLSAPPAPRLGSIAAVQNVPYGDVTQITATGSDLDTSQTLTYSVSGGFGTIDPTTGVYTSGNVALGMADQPVTITVSDSHSPPQTASETFTIHPVFTSPVVVVNDHIYYAQDLLSNGALMISVPAGQPLTLSGSVADSASDAPLTSDINLNDFVSTGINDQTLPLNADGSFSLTHTYVTARSFQVAITVVNSAGYRNLALIFVTVTSSDSGGSGSGGSGSGGSGSGGSGSGGGTVTPLVGVSSIVETVTKGSIADFKVQFNGSVTGADNPSNYQLALVTTKKVKKHTVTTTKLVRIKSVSYNATTDLSEIFLVGKIPTSKINQLTITAAGITDSLGRAIDGNHDGQAGGNLVAKVGKGSVSIQ